jgi:hypothetical protein
MATNRDTMPRELRRGRMIKKAAHHLARRAL